VAPAGVQGCATTSKTLETLVYYYTLFITVRLIQFFDSEAFIC
jgi:hypothetical protein